MQAKIARTSLENSFPPRYIDDTKIYLSISGDTPIAVKNSKKSVLRLFNKSGNLKKFIKSKKIKLNNLESFIEVIKFMDQ